MKQIILAIIFCVLGSHAYAQCTNALNPIVPGLAGAPFTCEAGSTPQPTDIVQGGAVATGRTVGWTWSEVIGTLGIVGPGATVINNIACWNNVAGTSLDGCTNGTIGSISLTTGPLSIQNILGTSGGLFTVYPAYAWEEAAGTNAAPITTAGPSLKVSRTENIAIASCFNTFNDNECNAAIYGASANSSSFASADAMQLTGVLGTALTYSTQITGEAVGVQGIARAVGTSVAGVAGAYFEGRYDSTATRSYYYTVGVEARSNNRSGTPAVADFTDGNSFNSFLATTGSGAGSQNANAGLMVTASSPQFLYGVVVGSGTAITASFLEYSNSVTGLFLGGTHTNAIASINFNVTGNGNLWIGENYNSATATHFTIESADANQVYISSTGANANFIDLDNEAGGQIVSLQFEDNSVAKWNVEKAANNNFVILDNAASATVLRAVSGSALYLGNQQSFTINATNGATGIGGTLTLSNSASWVAATNCGSLSSSTKCLALIDPNGNTVYLPVYGTF